VLGAVLVRTAPSLRSEGIGALTLEEDDHGLKARRDLPSASVLVAREWVTEPSAKILRSAPPSRLISCLRSESSPGKTGSAVTSEHSVLSQAAPKPSSRSAEGLRATRIVSNVGHRRTTRRRGRRPGRRPAVIGTTLSSAHMAGQSSRAGLQSKPHDSGQRIGCTDGITRQ
jgi:hypothetical protein